MIGFERQESGLHFAEFVRMDITLFSIPRRPEPRATRVSKDGGERGSYTRRLRAATAPEIRLQAIRRNVASRIASRRRASAFVGLFGGVALVARTLLPHGDQLLGGGRMQRHGGV